MAISVYDKFKVWDSASVTSGDTSTEIWCNIADALGIYFNLSASIDIALEALIDTTWIEVYRWENPGTDWVHDTFIVPMSSKVRLKALGAATVTAYVNLKR